MAFRFTLSNRTTSKYIEYMKLIIRYLLAFAGLPGLLHGSALASDSAHNFLFTSIEGDSLSLSSFRGKAVLIVNTASRCGFTRQYSELQTLWSQYRSRGLVVLGVPSNDFGNQEPGTLQEIKTFCEVNYDIDFPMTEKVKIRGEGAHPFYLWASQQAGLVGTPRWNFHKYLIDSKGELVDWFSSLTKPMSTKILNAVEAHLPDRNGG